MADPTKSAPEPTRPPPAPAPPPPPSPVAPDHTVAPVARTRPPDAIKGEVEAARKEHADLMKQVEQDRDKVNRRSEAIKKAMERWKVQRQDEPFDPDSFDPPMRPLVHDAELNLRFHNSHYRVADLERELDAATKVKPATTPA